MNVTCQKYGLWMAGPRKMNATCHENARKMAGPPKMKGILPKKPLKSTRSLENEGDLA